MTSRVRNGLASLLTSLLLAATLSLRAQSLAFSPLVTYPSGGPAPMGVALGDVTGDGVLDQAVANFGGRTLGILAGVGDGTFQPAATYPAGTPNLPQGIKLGDLNNDGQLDAVLASTDGLGVLLNQGGGTFGPAASYPVTMTGNPNSMALADLNNDGWLDVVTVSYLNGLAYVLLNQGNGTFGAATGYLISSSGSSPETLALGDVTGDGRPDLVVATGNGSTLAVLPGTGTGGFGTAQLLGGGGSVWVALGDVNNDGRTDILADDSFAGGFVTYLGQAGGGFAYAPAYHTPQSGTAPVLVDVDGDGLLDIVAPAAGGRTIAVTLGVSGGFGPTSSLAPGADNLPICTAVDDVNGDGRRDIVLANNGKNTVSVLLNTTPVLALANPGSGRAGSSLTLRGQGLAGATAVTFSNAVGGATPVPASSFTATNYTAQPNTITLPIPATLLTGSYVVRVATPRGPTNGYSFQVTALLATVNAALPTISLLLVPNPAHGATTLLLTAPAGTSSARLQVRDAQGNLVQKGDVAKPVTDLAWPLNVAGLAPGLYFLSVEVDGQSIIRRLVVN
jgi:hypothetical protein